MAGVLLFKLSSYLIACDLSANGQVSVSRTTTAMLRPGRRMARCERVALARRTLQHTWVSRAHPAADLRFVVGTTAILEASGGVFSRLDGGCWVDKNREGISSWGRARWHA
eukprot:scaffold1243_cov403-Prasinococcus_capsulatus_cf.AAC.30